MFATEGKTDTLYLMRAQKVLKIARNLRFPVNGDMGDDRLLKQCEALSKVAHTCPQIFVFDRDKPDFVRKVDDASKSYMAWDNNVFSFAIPVPAHRSAKDRVCIELYFNDSDLSTKDRENWRLFFASEFNASSGRHLSDPRLSVAYKGRLSSVVLDADVYNENHINVALPKSDFANYVASATGPFGHFDFKHFEAIFSVIDTIISEQAVSEYRSPGQIRLFRMHYRTFRSLSPIVQAMQTMPPNARQC